ncbi:enoyl-CoA hydratase-related protein [Pseudorhodoferax sp. LjRoot39]|uniref:enoyl-CoA hydratase/isomerase family protein n=1 Tax=Pseudorhodoferax sp. LjRoot39 TaxID=3342328 RepID=UPI003ECD91F5
MSGASPDTGIRLERLDDGVALLTLARPERLNAFTPETMRALHTVVDGIERDAALRAVVLVGEGRGFCAGLDLKALAPELLEPTCSLPAWVEVQELFSGMMRRLRALDKVVIAAVHGAAVGAGFALALAADIRVAGRSASFHVGAVKIGLTAGECGISYHLPRLIGASRAFELLLTGRPVTADEAERIGLVSAVVEDAELAGHALALARQVLQNSPYATRHTKQLMWTNLDTPSLDAALQLENRAQVMALMTDDFREAAAAFAQKRPPIFRNQ